MLKKIGIIEVCQPTHYSVVNGLLKAYTYDKNNVVYVFVLEKIADALNITMDASQTRLDNARRHIKKMLEHPWVPGKCA